MATRAEERFLLDPSGWTHARRSAHPDLRILVYEGGATWGPFIADRMDEGYRQHGAGVRPKLSKLPSQYLYEHGVVAYPYTTEKPVAVLGAKYRWARSAGLI